MMTTSNSPLVPLLLALAALPAAAPLASAQPDRGVINSLSVAADATATTLILRTSRRFDWTASWLSGGELQLTFPASVVADDIIDLTPDHGLIASVAVARSQIAGRPATTLGVVLRRPASYSATVSRRQLEFTFLPRVDLGSSELDVVDDPAMGSAAVAETSTPAAAAAVAGAAASSDPVAPAPGARSEPDGEYRIGPGDLLEISVFGRDDFDHTVRVLRDGSISLPLLGGLRVMDMTLQEAASTVASLLAERRLFNAPQVTFFVKEYVSRGVSVQGAVERPGIYQMIQQRSLLEMLGEAGGLSGREDNRAGQQIFVIRKTPDGQQTSLEIDANQLVNQGRADLNLPLFPGDVILVPFSQKYRVYVSGAVVRPGSVDYLSSEGIMLLQAITAAGGPTERGNLSNVKILRRLPDGSETRIVVNVKRIRKGKSDDVWLQRNDTVIVGEWFF